MKDITLKALTPKEATDMLYTEFGIFCDELEEIGKHTSELQSR